MHAKCRPTCKNGWTLAEEESRSDIDLKDSANNSGTGGTGKWHNWWSSLFDVSQREVVMRKLSDGSYTRADVYADRYRVEFQSSYITRATIQTRSKFCEGQECLYYPRNADGSSKGYCSTTTPKCAIWIFDATDKQFELFRFPSVEDGCLRMKVSWNEPFTGLSDVHKYYIDVGCRELLQVMPSDVVDGNPAYKVKVVSISMFFGQHFTPESLVPNFASTCNERTDVQTLIKHVDRDPALPSDELLRLFSATENVIDHSSHLASHLESDLPSVENPTSMWIKGEAVLIMPEAKKQKRDSVRIDPRTQLLPTYELENSHDRLDEIIDLTVKPARAEERMVEAYEKRTAKMLAKRARETERYADTERRLCTHSSLVAQIASELEMERDTKKKK
jgi:hypothetical protein